MAAALRCLLLVSLWPGLVASAWSQDPATQADPTRNEASRQVVGRVVAGKYLEPILHPLVFDLDSLGMIEAERRQYAASMAAFALAAVAASPVDAGGKLGDVPQAKYDFARKLIGLASHLDPRSRAVVVANGRLKAGVLSAVKPDPGMAPGTFASLLVGRAVELQKSGGEQNSRLAGCFLDLALAMDPSSDDVVFAYETSMSGGRKPDWSGILGGE